MKKFISLILMSTFICLSINAQNVAGRNGTVHFPTIADYEYFVENPESRTAITSFTASRGISTMKGQYLAAETQMGAIPAEAEDMPEFLQEVLNADKIVAIGSFYVKIDLQNQRVLAIQSNVDGSYNSLVSDNLERQRILQF